MIAKLIINFDSMIKIFFFLSLKELFEPIFYQVLWRFLSSGCRFPPSLKLRRTGGIFGQTLAPPWRGEMRPNYFQYLPPDRKSQIHRVRLASLGDRIVRFSGRKKQLAILLLGKENFLIKTI